MIFAVDWALKTNDLYISILSEITDFNSSNTRESTVTKLYPHLILFLSCAHFTPDNPFYIKANPLPNCWSWPLSMSTITWGNTSRSGQCSHTHTQTHTHICHYHQLDNRLLRSWYSKTVQEVQFKLIFKSSLFLTHTKCSGKLKKDSRVEDIVIVPHFFACSSYYGLT